jgi:hypothetical protein
MTGLDLVSFFLRVENVTPKTENYGIDKGLRFRQGFEIYPSSFLKLLNLFFAK